MVDERERERNRRVGRRAKSCTHLLGGQQAWVECGGKGRPSKYSAALPGTFFLQTPSGELLHLSAVTSSVTLLFPGLLYFSFS